MTTIFEIIMAAPMLWGFLNVITIISFITAPFCFYRMGRRTAGSEHLIMAFAGNALPALLFVAGLLSFVWLSVSIGANMLSYATARLFEQHPLFPGDD